MALPEVGKPRFTLATLIVVAFNDLMIETTTTLAIVGATGAVGSEALSILAEREFDPDRLRLFASHRSAGSIVEFRDQSLIVEDINHASFESIDMAIFCASGDVSRAIAQSAVADGCFVIDNSSAYRMHDDVPLIVPEVNGNVLDNVNAPCIIANPNCSTIIALVAIAPLHRAATVSRMVINTYQAVSGAGAAAMAELEQQTQDFAENKPLTQAVFDRPCLFNVFSHDSPIDEQTGNNQEENKLINETHKILGDTNIGISATCVRVPVLRTHCECINLTLENTLREDDARAILQDAPGIQVIDDRINNRFPEPYIASHRDDIYIGRIRNDPSQPAGRGLNFFVCGDQLRKGAALNAIQIAERLQVRQPHQAV